MLTRFKKMLFLSSFFIADALTVKAGEQNEEPSDVTLVRNPPELFSQTTTFQPNLFSKPVLNEVSSTAIENYVEYIFLGLVVPILFLLRNEFLHSAKKAWGIKPSFKPNIKTTAQLTAPITHAQASIKRPLKTNPLSMITIPSQSLVEIKKIRHSKKSKNDLKTAAVLAAIAKRHQQTEAKKESINHAPSPARVKRIQSWPVPCSTVAKISAALERRHSTNSSHSRVNVDASLPLLPHKKNLLDKAQVVLSHAKELVKISSKICHNLESIKTRQLSILFHLHKYNLAFLSLIKHHPSFHNHYYDEFVLPMRTGFSHFSSHLSPTEIEESFQKFLPALKEFVSVEKYNTFSLLKAFNFNCELFKETSIYAHFIKSRFHENLKRKVDRKKDAESAFNNFEENYLPDILNRLTELNFNQSNDVFCEKDKTQALCMLITLSLDNLSSDTIARLKKNPEKFSTEKVELISTLRKKIRNRVAHYVEDVPDEDLKVVCQLLRSLLEKDKSPQKIQKTNLTLR